MLKKDRIKLQKTLEEHVAKHYPNNLIETKESGLYEIRRIDIAEGSLISVFGAYTTTDKGVLHNLLSKFNVNPYSGKYNLHVAHKGLSLKEGLNEVLSHFARIQTS